MNDPFTKPLGMPNWVAPNQHPNVTYGGPSAAHTNVVPGKIFGDPSAIGAGAMGSNPYAGGVDFGQPSVGRHHNPAFNWSGQGPNPNDRPNMQHGYGGEQQQNQLPPQLQQFIAMMKGGGQMPQGFMGFNPVDHNPFGNVNPWGQDDTGNGMYGGLNHTMGNG